MSPSWFLACIGMVSAICCPIGISARDRQSTSEQDNRDELLEVLKLDPVILNAIKPDPNDTPLRKLQREHCYTQAIALAKFQVLMEIGKWIGVPETFTVPVSFSKDLLELIEKPADRVKCYEFRVEFLKQVEEHLPHQVAIGNQQSYALNLAAAARMDAEIELLAFKTKLAKAKE